jgi:hypothetical protein
LTSDCKTDIFNIIARLDVTIKTHKPLTEQVPRAIHGAPKHLFAPGMRYIANRLRTSLNSFPHILKDSDHFMRVLTGMLFEPTDRIIKLDIKDFFMSGEINPLVLHSMSLISDPGERSVLAELLRIVLTTQLICIPGDPTRSRWRVKIGSGMGLIVSGEVSDSAFLQMAEVTTILQPSFREKYNVRLWLRFKDDIFCVVGAGPADDLLRELRHYAKFFKLKVESVDTLSRLVEQDRWVCFLDLDVTPTFHADGLIFKFRPYRKPTSIWRPLSYTSNHAASIHLSWAGAYAQRLSRHSSNSTDREEALTDFRNMLRLRGVCHPGAYIDMSTASATTRVKQPASRIVLPYHELWAQSDFTNVLKSFDAVLQRIGFPVVRIAWSLAGPHLSKRLKNI